MMILGLGEGTDAGANYGMVPLAQDRGHPNKTRHLRPVHYVGNPARPPARVEMTQSGTSSETGQSKWGGAVPPGPGIKPARDQEASSLSGG